MLWDGNSAAWVDLKELDSVFYKRKTVLNKIRKSTRNAILEELAQAMRSLLKTSTKTTTTALIAGKDSALESIRKQARNAQAELEGLHSARMSALQALKRRNEQDEITKLGVDEEEGLDVVSLDENDDKQHPGVSRCIGKIDQKRTLKWTLLMESRNAMRLQKKNV